MSKSRETLHMIVEKDTQQLVYGTSSYTVFIKPDGEPDIKTLKVSKSRRIKYSSK